MAKIDKEKDDWSRSCRSTAFYGMDSPLPKAWLRAAGVDSLGQWRSAVEQNEGSVRAEAAASARKMRQNFREEFSDGEENKKPLMTCLPTWASGQLKGGDAESERRAGRRHPLGSSASPRLLPPTASAEGPIEESDSDGEEHPPFTSAIAPVLTCGQPLFYPEAWRPQQMIDIRIEAERLGRDIDRLIADTSTIGP
ncbi:protein SOGA3-like isoform X4 [Lates japonicus]|uniref:Protein SOGA3-like isoform X4 n=1 Tax=Lates japonicus TaxID=270547 RepID=A0AAD3M5R7_LATJO|nr:protein SOGA3-like isoform X4 [Lates japonicus]